MTFSTPLRALSERPNMQAAMAVCEAHLIPAVVAVVEPPDPPGRVRSAVQAAEMGAITAAVAAVVQMQAHLPME
jgi:hypothetical protein